MRAGATLAFAALLVSSPSAARLPAEAAFDVISADVPAGEIAFETGQGTWLSVDVAPDGRTLLFDLLGDIYRLGIEGGQAVPLITGDAFETQPAFSPDGQSIAFVSDRDGSENLWVADADGGNARALSDDTEAVFVDPAWSSDGRTLYVTRFDSRNRLNDGIRGALWAYRLDGRGGAALEGKVESEAKQALGAAPSSDGRYLYFSAGPDGRYTLYRRDLRSGETLVQISGEGVRRGALQPVPSPDGRYLAYAVDTLQATQLRLRDLRSGEDRLLLPEIEPSLAGTHGTSPFQGLLPRYAFTPDAKAIVIGYGGGLHRLDLASEQVHAIPFRAPVRLAARPHVERQPLALSGPVRARLIQGARLSPDGRRLAFAAFGKLHVAEAGSAHSRRLTSTPIAADAAAEYQPTWSPDGRWIAYASWSSGEGGHLWRVRSDGRGTPQRLTRVPAYYQLPEYAPDGRSVLALRVAAEDHRRGISKPGEWGHNIARWWGAVPVVQVPAGGGPDRQVATLPNRETDMYAPSIGPFQFVDDGRVYLYTPEGLLRFALPRDGAAPETAEPVLKVEAARETFSSQAVDRVQISPDGRWLLATHGFQLKLAPVPAGIGSAEVPTLRLGEGVQGERQITSIGAHGFAWSPDGREVTWTLGSGFYRVPLAQLLQSGPAPAGDACAEDGLERWQVVAELPRAAVAPPLVLRNARVVTMRGAEVIERADVVVADGRIAAVGPAGSVPLRGGVRTLDLQGRTVTPGFVDTHAHLPVSGMGFTDYDAWALPAALAYGVTTVRDPQLIDKESYLVAMDLVEAGGLTGPRMDTTGPGIFASERIRSLPHARCLVRRYRDGYGLGSLKAYMLGNRMQRQWVAQAARELGVMVVGEGWGVPRYAVTHALDGYADHEHASDAIDWYDDHAQVYVRTGTGYVPTLLAGGAAGLWGADHFLSQRDLLGDTKLARFMPRAVLEKRLASISGVPRAYYSFDAFARSAARLARAGANVGVGAHGELQGLGYHLELQAYASGGMTPHEILQAATRGSARVLGLQDLIGTIEPGKLADLLVFERDPLQDIRNAEALAWVIRQGRPYEADTLDEVLP